MKDTMPAFVRDALRSDRIDVDRLFIGLLLAFVVIILVTTFEYSAEGRLVPLIVGVPTLLMLVVLLAIKTSSRFAALVDGLTYGDLFGIDETMESVSEYVEESDRDAPADRVEARARVVVIISWIGAAFGLILVTGFLVGLLLFMVAFYRVQARQRWSRTLLYSFVAWAFIFLIFQVVLDAPLYQGLLGIDLVGAVTDLL